MAFLEYKPLDQISAEEFIPLLNDARIRRHLMPHQPFDLEMVTSWIHAKLDVDATPGCRVRAVVADERLAGWCGIQWEDGNHEIAIVLEHRSWGLGKQVFQEVMAWARMFNHQIVVIHLLHTRPEYRFLRKIASKVYQSEVSGNRFLTYELPVAH